MQTIFIMQTQAFRYKKVTTFRVELEFRFNSGTIESKKVNNESNLNKKNSHLKLFNIITLLYYIGMLNIWLKILGVMQIF